MGTLTAVVGQGFDDLFKQWRRQAVDWLPGSSFI
jgi:hypothetical protein